MRRFIAGSLCAAVLVGCGGSAFEGANVGLLVHEDAGRAGGRPSVATITSSTGSAGAGSAGTMASGGAAGAPTPDAGGAETSAAEAAAPEAASVEASPEAGGSDAAPCAPITQCASGENCGDVDDGCGGRLHCGECRGSDLCGVGGQPRACAPCPAGSTCGTACGTCKDPMKCGAGTDPMKCGYWAEHCSTSPIADPSICVYVPALGPGPFYCPSNLYDWREHPECHQSAGTCIGCKL